MSTAAQTIEDVQEIVRGAAPGVRLLPVAGASKTGLSRSALDDVERVDVSALSGVLEYDPAELTITALAGTPVSEIAATLAEHGQYLPFDPPLAGAGATLGGAVATGASGAGALRYGGVRDFVIGVRFIDGAGRLISGGGKVVKNAAGFDLPKLMVGSIGRLGVLVALSFKVFPRPAATVTLEYGFGSVARAVEAASAVMRCPVELEALEVGDDGGLWARLGGRSDTLEARLARLTATLEAVPTRIEGEAELALWRDAAEFHWVPEGHALVRVGLSLRSLGGLDAAFAAAGVVGARVRYGLGGTVAWISWPVSERSLDALEALLRGQGLAGMVLLGPPDRALLGRADGGAFGARLRGALDPHNRFLEVV